MVAGMKPGLFWRKNDMRPRAKGAACEEPVRSMRFGRRPDHSARPPIASASRLHQGAARTGRTANVDYDRSGATRRFKDAQEEFQTAEQLESITRRVDELAQEFDRRGNRSAKAEIAALKHCLTELSCEIGRRAERKLFDTDQGIQRNGISPVSRAASVNTDAEIAAIKRSLADLSREISRQMERGLKDAGPVGELPGNRRRFENPQGPTDAARPLDWIANRSHDDSREADRRESRATDTIVAGLGRYPRESSEIALDQVERTGGRPGHFGRRERHVRDGACEAKSTPPAMRRDRRQNDVLETTAPADRRTASTDQARARTKKSADPLMMSARARVLPPIPARIHPVRRTLASHQERPRSRVLPLAIASLAGLLAVAILIAGTHFVRSHVTVPYVGTLALPSLFRHDTSVAETAASRPTGILPRYALARLQDLKFPLPELYGVYAINRGKLFELETLPGQVPDHRIAMSAPVSRPSRTTLSDGHVAFVVFRRDVTDNISERVPIRVVARIKRPISDPVSESPSTDAWTIRNVALDFRVAPVDQNKDMVLLRPESPDFTFPAGRYVLVIKGQAYDFTVDGPITDPAQCLERVEAANGSFFHQCQPETTATGPLPQEAPPSPALPLKSRRHAEARANLPEQAAKPR